MWLYIAWSLCTATNACTNTKRIFFFFLFLISFIIVHDLISISFLLVYLQPTPEPTPEPTPAPTPQPTVIWNKYYNFIVFFIILNSFPPDKSSNRLYPPCVKSSPRLYPRTSRRPPPNQRPCHRHPFPQRLPRPTPARRAPPTSAATSAYSSQLRRRVGVNGAPIRRWLVTASVMRRVSRAALRRLIWE